MRSKEKNTEGVYDMSGNVWEWFKSTDSSGSNGRVCRGGSMNYSAIGCTVANRIYYAPRTSGGIGFRVVRNAD